MYAILFSGGLPAPPEVAAHLPLAPLVVAADSGYRDARAMRLAVDLLVGDLDSIAADDLRHAEAHAVTVERHPSDKDATDLELAMDAAAARGATALTVVSGGGGRLDHLLGAAALLAAPRYAALEIDAWIGDAYVQVVHGPGSLRIRGQAGELLTLLAVAGPAEGIVTTGLRYPLRGERLQPFETRGLSNVVVAPAAAAVELSAGTLLVIRPTALVVAKEGI